MQFTSYYKHTLSHDVDYNSTLVNYNIRCMLRSNAYKRAYMYVHTCKCSTIHTSINLNL